MKQINGMIEATQNNMPQVPFRPNIQPMESGRGYLIRVADALGYKTPLMLTRLIGANLAGIDNKNVLIKLAHLLRVPYLELESHFYRSVKGPHEFLQRSFFGNCISSNFLNYDAPRVCPACISENPTCLGNWDLNLVTVCPTHGCELIDICPKCKKRLHWHRSFVAECPCGYDLGSAEPKQASTNVIALTEIIYQAITSSNAQNENTKQAKFSGELMALSLPSLLRVIRYLGATFHPSSTNMTQLRYSRNDLSKAKEIVEAASTTLSQWPSNYLERLQEANQKYQVTDVYDKKIAEAFGNYYRHLFKVLKESEFDFLRSKFEEFLNAKWDGLIRGQHRLLTHEVRETQHWISASQAIETLGIKSDRKMLRRLAEDGVIKGKRMKDGPKGRYEIWLERSSLEKWVKESKKWIPRGKVEVMLGLKHETVMALGSAGLMKYKKGGVAGKLVSWNFLEHDVQHILDAFQRHQVSVKLYKDKCERQIALQHALVDFLGRNGLINVINAVMDGRLIPIARAGKFKGIRDYIFATAQLRKFRPVDTDIQFPQGGFLNSKESTRILQVDKCVVTALVREGFLSNPSKYVFGEERLIPVKDVAAFKERYIFAGHLAEQIGSGAIWINRFLATRKIEGIELKLANERYIKFYERNSLANIRIPMPEHKRQLSGV